ncbi:MAG TPA: hypothetical protein DCM05_16510 [Elusimicrobia bacterium]|nr:hypothetical protein [Elusimicrobiota bacterium]
MRMTVALAASLAWTGCSTGSGGLNLDSGPTTTREMTDEVRRSERLTLESLTLSRLSAIERSLNDFIRAERRIPKRLEELVPKYLAEIPEAETGVRGHKDNSGVRYYAPSIIVDGQVNGTKLKDTGGWGYVHNEQQVIVFVDCVHKMMDGKFWYQARGVY